VAVGHFPQSNWQPSAKHVSRSGSAVQNPSPQNPSQIPATQSSLVHAPSVVHRPPGGTEFAAMQIGKLQTPLAQSLLASQGKPLASGSMHSPRMLHTPVSHSESSVQPLVQLRLIAPQLPLSQ
jgi:hypothetical protein